MAAPGAVLASSNERDVAGAARDPRAELGQVWIFDQRQIADESPVGSTDHTVGRDHADGVLCYRRS